MALQRGCREIYAYDGKTWNKQENDDLEEKAVKFLDENEFNYSDSTIERLIKTLKAQLPRMGEMSNANRWAFYWCYKHGIRQNKNAPLPSIFSLYKGDEYR